MLKISILTMFFISLNLFAGRIKEDTAYSRGGTEQAACGAAFSLMQKNSPNLCRFSGGFAQAPIVVNRKPLPYFSYVGGVKRQQGYSCTVTFRYQCRN